MGAFTTLVPKWVKGILVALVMVPLLAPFATASANSSPRDYNDNSIIWGGAYSKSELNDKLDRGDDHHTAADIQHVYFSEDRGITRSNLMSGDTVDGTTYKDGRVVVNGQVVATDAQSVGRHNFTGTHQNGSVWESSNQSSFLSDSIPVWVNMAGGQFHYMVIKSCGNPGSATPTTQAQSSPSPSASPSNAWFRCDNLMVRNLSSNTTGVNFRFSVISTVQNVHITGYHFSFSDGDNRDIGSDTNYIDHTFAPGSWTVRAQLKTDHGWTDQSDACTAHVTVNQGATTQPATPTPSPQPVSTGAVLGATTLPNTGSASVLGGLVGLAAISLAAYFYLRSRKSLLTNITRRGRR